MYQLKKSNSYTYTAMPKKTILNYCTISAENIHFSSTQKSIQLADIVMLKADVNYTYFYLANGKCIVFSKTMKTFAELLPSCSFIRTHKTYLINKHYLKSVNQEEDLINLSNGMNVPISRRKRRSVLPQIMNN